MNRILWVIIATLLLFLGILIFLNRGHAKIQEAIIITVTSLLAVVFGTIFFSSDNDEINKEISIVYFVTLNRPILISELQKIQSIKGSILDPTNKDGVWLETSPIDVRLKQNIDLNEMEIRRLSGKDFDKIWNFLHQSIDNKAPVFFTVPILMNYLMPSGMVWGYFLNKNPEKAKEIFRNIPNNFDTLIDLQVAALIQHMSMFYKMEWNIERTSKISFPAFSSVGGRILSPSNKDKKEYSKEKLIKIFPKNIFLENLDNIGFAVPKGTQISYYPPDSKNTYSRIRFYKRFAFDAEIRFYFSAYNAGLGKVGIYTGLTKPTNKWNVNWEERDNFGTVIIGMSCKVNFFKLRSGDPTILGYKTWFDNLFQDLFNTFDWSVCDKEMRDYNEELANQYIVSTLGNGLDQKSPEDKPKP